ncbi:MAG: hypothetical protein R6W96_04165 [Clostridia bacterium]
MRNEGTIGKGDRAILRDLAQAYRGFTLLPEQKQTAEAWKDLNDLHPLRPMVYIFQIPWHEMDVNGELALRTSHPLARKMEEHLRRSIYQFTHMRGDMVLPDVLYSPLSMTGTSFGIREEAEYARTDEGNPVCSRHFHIQIQCMEDVGKISMPHVKVDWEQSKRDEQALSDALGGILEVRMRGTSASVCNAWDELIRYTGVTEGLTALHENPELVHAAISRMTKAYMERIRQWEELGALASNNGPFLAGNGGYGFTRQLPGGMEKTLGTRTMEMWGGAMSQIFSDVSPAMHDTFALHYEKQFMELFGLNYYGCCEPLHGKMEVVKKIPRLRKISMSPWADPGKGAMQMKGDHVFSYKPSPSLLAMDVFSPEECREEIRRVLWHAKEHNCPVEVILKDISTVRYEPRRLWEWADMAMEAVREQS